MPRMPTRSIALRGVLAASVVLVSSAGACRQEWEGDLPPPAELGAAPFPDGTRRGGVEAIYATVVSGGGEGTSCYDLVRLGDDGTARTAGICTEQPIADVAASPDAWSNDPGLGAYAWRDGTIWVQIVAWDSLAEELVLSEYVRSYCGRQLSVERERSGGPDVTSELVAGDPPPDAAPCP